MANRQQQPPVRQPQSAQQQAPETGFYQHRWEQFTEEHPKWNDVPENMRPYMAVDANTGLVHAYNCPPEMIRRDEKSGEIMNVARTVDQVLPWIPYMTYMPEFDRKGNAPRTWMDIKTPQRVQLVKDWKKPLVSRYGIAKYNKEDENDNNKSGGGGGNRNANSARGNNGNSNNNNRGGNNARGNNSNPRNNQNVGNNNNRGGNNNNNRNNGNRGNNNSRNNWDDGNDYDDGGQQQQQQQQQKTNVAELQKDFDAGIVKVIKRTMKWEQQGENACPEAIAYARALDIRCVECILPHIQRLFPDDIGQDGEPIPTTNDMVRRDMYRIYAAPKNRKGKPIPNPDNRPWKIKGQIVLKSAWPDFIRETCIKRAELNAAGGWDLHDVKDLQEKFDLLERQNVACVPVVQPVGAEAFETGGWGANQFITDIIVLPSSCTVTIANDFIPPEGTTINYCSGDSSSSSSALSNQEKSDIERKFMAAHNERIAGQVNKRKADALQLTARSAPPAQRLRHSGPDDNCDDNNVDCQDNDNDNNDGSNDMDYPDPDTDGLDQDF